MYAGATTDAPSAKARRAKLEQERRAMEAVAPPTKSRYIDVHTPDTWTNPYIRVGVKSLTLRIVNPDANPSPVGQGSMLRPAAARTQELEINPDNLPEALTSLPGNAWPYGRVIAVAESPTTDGSLRPQIRRNLELTIQTLTDLGIVADEWPTR